MDERLLRNLPTISEEEQRILAEKRVLVAGCGGLGAYLAEYLTRLGVRHLTILDGDSFEITNCNRQLLATAENRGKNKALCAAERAKQINPLAVPTALCTMLTAENAERLLTGHTLILDALDNRESRLLLEDACEALSLPLIHGAVHGWVFQAATIMPGDRLLHRLYEKEQAEDKSVLSFVPPCCAAVQTAEAVRILLGRPPLLENRLFLADMETMEQQSICF